MSNPADSGLCDQLHGCEVFVDIRSRPFTSSHRLQIDKKLNSISAWLAKEPTHKTRFYVTDVNVYAAAEQKRSSGGLNPNLQRGGPTSSTRNLLLLAKTPTSKSLKTTKQKSGSRRAQMLLSNAGAKRNKLPPPLELWERAKKLNPEIKLVRYEEFRIEMETLDTFDQSDPTIAHNHRFVFPFLGAPAGAVQVFVTDGRGVAEVMPEVVKESPRFRDDCHRCGWTYGSLFSRKVEQLQTVRAKKKRRKPKKNAKPKEKFCDGCRSKYFDHAEHVKGRAHLKWQSTVNFDELDSIVAEINERADIKDEEDRLAREAGDEIEPIDAFMFAGPRWQPPKRPVPESEDEEEADPIGSCNSADVTVGGAFGMDGQSSPSCKINKMETSCMYVLSEPNEHDRTSDREPICIPPPVERNDSFPKPPLPPKPTVPGAGMETLNSYSAKSAKSVRGAPAKQFSTVKIARAAGSALQGTRSKKDLTHDFEKGIAESSEPSPTLNKENRDLFQPALGALKPQGSAATLLTRKKPNRHSAKRRGQFSSVAIRNTRARSTLRVKAYSKTKDRRMTKG